MQLSKPGVAALALLLSLPATALADPDSGVDAQLYRPSYDPNGVFSLEGAEVMSAKDFSFKFGVGYAKAPFAVAVPLPGADDAEADTVLDFVLAMHMTLAFSFTDNLELGLDTGLYRTDTDTGYGERGLYDNQRPEPSTGLIALRLPSNIDPSGGFEPQGLSAPLDVRLGLKWRFLVAREGLSAALVGSAHVPFGEEEMFLGDESFVLEPRIALDYKFDALSRTKLVANAGVRFRERTVLESKLPQEDAAAARAVLDVGPEAVAGAGFVIELLPQLLLAAEAVAFIPLPAALALGNCELDSGMECNDLEDAMYYEDAGYGDLASYAMGGINYRLTPDTTLVVSGGAGLMGARADDFRVLGGINWSPTPSGARTIGRGDRDGDGIPDTSDICPDEPEDQDGYQDEDGCPELDNDGDGIIDERDACVDEPEDRDGYQDEDGCPERDNDGDGIPDVTDRCPSDPEDMDGFEDDDGCPDQDNDGDGFADDKDRCPNDPETLNGVDDNDGCPDERVKTGPQESSDRINLMGNRVDFANERSATLTRGSRLILDQVAEIIKRRNIDVRIEVHVPLSTASSNARVVARARQRDKSLSQQRANAIVEYLVKSSGVPPALVQGIGIGSERPTGNNPAADPLNERVDFIKVRQSAPQ